MIIYKITNRVNGKVYIGQTVLSLDLRWRQHCSKHTNCRVMSSAIKKYGKENFTVEQIDVASDRDELNEKEQHWIQHYNCIVPNGYNLTSGGNQRKASKETRDKISESIKGERNPFYGKHHTEETKQYLRSINIGKKASTQTKLKLTQSRLGDKNHFYGKHHTDASKLKISQSRVGKYGGSKHPRARAVICLETGVIYPYIRKASQETGVHETHITSCCRGKLPHAGGFHWEYVNKEL